MEWLPLTEFVVEYEPTELSCMIQCSQVMQRGLAPYREDSLGLGIWYDSYVHVYM